MSLALERGQVHLPETGARFIVIAIEKLAPAARATTTPSSADARTLGQSSAAPSCSVSQSASTAHRSIILPGRRLEGGVPPCAADQRPRASAGLGVGAAAASGLIPWSQLPMSWQNRFSLRTARAAPGVAFTRRRAARIGQLPV